MIRFEFDSVKSDANQAKHGIDFVAAQMLWLDVDLLEVKAKTFDDPRSLIIGKIGEKHWSAVVTYRGDAVRIISIRRARRAEVALYES